MNQARGLFFQEIYCWLKSDKDPTCYRDSKHLQNKAETGERSLKLKLLILWKRKKKHSCMNISRPSERRGCLHPDVIVSVRWAFWRTPHCSAAANYLQGLTPNKSALCEFMLNRPWLTGVPRRWNTAPSSRRARLPFVPRSHPSSAALLCFEVSFISPRVSASQLIRPLVQTPTARCWFS